MWLRGWCLILGVRLTEGADFCAEPFVLQSQLFHFGELLSGVPDSREVVLGWRASSLAFHFMPALALSAAGIE